LSVPVAAQLPATPHSTSLLLGAAWYPEQWPESRWEADLSPMEAAHIHLVRVTTSVQVISIRLPRVAAVIPFPKRLR